MSNDLLTQLEVAEHLKVCPKTVYNIIQSGELKSVKVGEKGVRITREALDEYLGKANGEGNGMEVSLPALRENELLLAENHVERWLDDMTKSKGCSWFVTETASDPSRCDWLDKLEKDFSDLVKRIRRKSCMDSG